MDKLLQFNVMGVLSTLPPDEYLAYCDTQDQRDFWQAVNLGYRYLRISFSCYFSGQAEPSQEEINFLFWGRIRDWYLALYTLIQRGWDEIETAFSEERQGLASYAKTPGEAFIRILEDDCAGIFSICLQPYYTASPHQERMWARLQRQVLSEKNPKKRLTFEKKLDAIDSKRLTLPIIHHMQARIIFLEILEGSKNELIRSNLTDYKRKTGDLDQYITSLNHPNKKRKGGVWNRGIYTQN